MGSYFFKSEVDHNVTVNRERYSAMIHYFFVSELEDVDVDDRCKNFPEIIFGTQ